MKKQQAGFTLIELIMVIVILGILSAFALPRFADLGSDARKASLKGALGAMKSAAGITHATQLARNESPNTAVRLEGQLIQMVNGYPTDTNAGIVRAANLSTDDYRNASGVITLRNYSGADCKITYTEATTTAAPDFELVDTGC